MWTDFLSDRHTPSFIIHERVLEVLVTEGIEPQHTSVVEFKGTVVPVTARPGGLNYVYATWPKAIDIDRDASGEGPPWKKCDACGRFTLPFPPNETIHVPLNRNNRMGTHFVPNSWRGQHLFSARANAVDRVYCTFKVLELARKHRWTGVYFNLAATPSDQSVGWKGINVLGKRWPPVLQPPEPSAGKTATQWLETNTHLLLDTELDYSDRREQSLRARLAILWLGPEVVDGLIAQLDHSAYEVRHDAVYLLGVICERERLDLTAKVQDLVAAIKAEPKQAGARVGTRQPIDSPIEPTFHSRHKPSHPSHSSQPAHEPLPSAHEPE